MAKAKKPQSKGLCLLDKIRDEEDESVINGLAIALCQVGIKTTSTTLLWCLYHLSRNPEVQEKAYREIVSVMGPTTCSTSLEPSQFYSQLPYVKACLKESMRLNYTISGVTRIIDKDTTLCGYNIPAKSTICIWPSCLSFSTKYFSKPQEFKPEGWIRGNQLGKVNPFAYIPFGFGVRMCLGRRFVELELALFVAHIMRSFRLEYVGNDNIRPLFKDGIYVPEKEPSIIFIPRT